jgi:Na+/proline symporter
MAEGALLSQGGIWFLALYLLSLILIGFAGKFASKEESLQDFYLGGRGFGITVLFLTMYATQYSGNSLIGFAGSAYRNGWFFLVGVVFMIAIVGGYLLYAPKLYPLSKKHGFITVGDFIEFRYSSRLLTSIIVAVSILALSNYMLTNLKAIGYILEHVSGGFFSFGWGNRFYGGHHGDLRNPRRDAQRGMDRCDSGCFALWRGAYYLRGDYDPLRYPRRERRPLSPKRPPFFETPMLEDQITWISILVLIVFGISVYPQAIQRIYAAKDAPTLKRSLTLMTLMPLLTTLPLIVIAIIGAAHFPIWIKPKASRSSF